VRAFENDTNPPDAGVLAIFQSLGKMNTNEASVTKGKEEASTSKAMAIKVQRSICNPSYLDWTGPIGPVKDRIRDHNGSVHLKDHHTIRPLKTG
jgi:hypothetical protein